MSCLYVVFYSVFYTSNILPSFAKLSVSYYILLFFCFCYKDLMYSILDNRSVFVINLFKNNDERNRSVSVCFRERNVIQSHILHHFSDL